MDIKWVGANPNNFQTGRAGKKVTKIVLHWIVGKLSAADATFQNPERIASAHYGIGHTEIHQYVKEEDTAYHAGNLTVNYESIGIEHEGGPDLPISEDTIKTSIQLVTDICRRYSIPADRQHIIKHSEVPRATQCPGTLDIDRIVREVQKNLAQPPSIPTDNISIPKTTFEDLVRKSTEYDTICDYFGFDRGSNNSGKVKDEFEKSRRSLAEKDKELETARKDRDQAISNVCPDPNAHNTGNGGNPLQPIPDNNPSNNSSSLNSLGISPGEWQTDNPPDFLIVFVNFIKKLFRKG